jgi:hypothetical protein
MINFKEFLNESFGIENVDTKLLLSNMEKLNQDLDSVTANPFLNCAIFFNAVRGTLERYGILLPSETKMHVLDMEGEVVYELHGTGHYVYIVYNQNKEGTLDGYAQIVNEDELNSLMALDNFDDVGGDDDVVNTVRVKYPPARRDDDSGNDAEYT